MDSIVGFTICTGLSPEETKRAYAAENRALSWYKHLEQLSIPFKCSTLHLWGHSPISDYTHTMPDGSLLVLVGSPHNEVAWQTVQDSLLKVDHPEDFVLPWEGRVILLRVSKDGRRWMLWNDWLGSIPVYYSEIGSGRIASTLNPVTVAAADFTPNDFFLPGLVSLLINGYPLADWTLYKNMKTLPPDSVCVWEEKGFRTSQLCSVQPSQDRWETGWDDLVDEMHALSYKAISDVLKTQSTWILTLSSGLDSRLIAGVAGDVGANVYAYAWGPADNTDVIYSRKIANTLGFPWKHIPLPHDFLVKYTPQWFDMFGTAIHFQGMYLMSFLNEISAEPGGPVLNGWVGDILSGTRLQDTVLFHSFKNYQIDHEWYSDWGPDQLKTVAKFSVDEALEANANSIQEQIESFPGARYQKILFLRLLNRQRSFISFLSTLKGYWRGVATPFVDRSYARFCFSLPRAVLDYRKLLGDVFRRYYGQLAVIPGSYGKQPYILTGSYLFRQRIKKVLPASIGNLLMERTDNLHICEDFEPIQTHGKRSLWPLFEVSDQLAEWLDLQQVEQDFQTVMRSKEDIRPLRRLQAVQTFASAFLSSKTGMS